MSPEIRHPVHRRIRGIAKLDAAVGLVGDNKTPGPGDAKHLAEDTRRVRNMEQHVAGEYKIKTSVRETELGGIPLPERDPRPVARVGGRPIDQSLIVFET